MPPLEDSVLSHLNNAEQAINLDESPRPRIQLARTLAVEAAGELANAWLAVERADVLRVDPEIENLLDAVEHAVTQLVGRGPQ